MTRNRTLHQPLAWTEKGAYIRRARHPWRWLAAFVSLCLLLIGLQSLGYLTSARDLLLDALTPAQVGLAHLATQARNVTQTLHDLQTLRQRNAELEAEVNRLLVENVQLKEIEAENANLRRLLAFAEQHPFFQYRGAQVVARVIGRDPNNLANFVAIDLGREQGMREGMPVITERGLVGRISRVSRNSSQVLLIIDPASAVNGMIQSSRLTGVVQGQVGGGLVIDYIPQDAKVLPGEIVITSGLGGQFPRDLVIGQVIAVRQRDYEMFQQAIVRPSVDFGQIEQVLVITDFIPIAEDEEATETPAESP